MCITCFAGLCKYKRSYIFCCEKINFSKKFPNCDPIKFNGYMLYASTKSHHEAFPVCAHWHLFLLPGLVSVLVLSNQVCYHKLKLKSWISILVSVYRSFFLTKLLKNYSLIFHEFMSKFYIHIAFYAATTFCWSVCLYYFCTSFFVVTCCGNINVLANLDVIWKPLFFCHNEGYPLHTVARFTLTLARMRIFFSSPCLQQWK